MEDMGYAARFDLTPYHKQSGLKPYYPGGGWDNAKHSCGCMI